MRQYTSSQQLLDYHRQIQRHIDLLRKVVTNLDLVDMAHRVGDWVEKAGVTDGDQSVRLSEILAGFEDINRKHWLWEENVAFLEFNIRGAAG